MTVADAAYYWLIFGITLMVLEAFIPGLVVIFLGMAACLVAGLIYFGYIDGWMQILTSWFISSLVLIILLRGLFQKIVPGEEEIGDVDEDQDAIGTIVEVVETVYSDTKTGRVRFRGTSWEAVSMAGKIEAGEYAKLVERKDMVWYVVPSPKH